MIESPALEFTIRSAGEPDLKLSVHSEIARIGSGAHCEIRLPAEAAALEQLQIEVRSGNVFGEARCAEPSALLNGFPFIRGRIAPDSVLQLGRVELQVRLIERDPSTGARRGRSRTTSRVMYALGGIGIPLGILLAAPRPYVQPLEWDLRPEPLWSSEEPFGCPESEHGSGAALADELRVQGESSRERAPFSPQDGVQAVELLSRAADCYATSGAEPRAEPLRALAAELKQDLSRQFHVHQVRLERALVSGDYDQAKRETRILRSFAAHRPSAYFDWLATLDRQMDVKYARSTP
jgi:hypothetical protein